METGHLPEGREASISQEAHRGNDRGIVPISLPLQPSPVLTRVGYIEVGDKTVTAIMRHWRPGDSGPSGHCHLCPSCRAYANGCLILVNQYVRRKDAPLFDTNGTPFQRRAPRARLNSSPKAGAG
jgi:hypothetical protein